MKAKILITLALICLVAADKDSYIYQQFTEFLAVSGKQYPTITEYMTRYNIFKKNYEKVEAMTISQDSSKTLRLGITKYMDMTPTEFRRIYLNLKISPSDLKNSGKDFLNYLGDVPNTLDWREKGAVGSVKDQGNCGSCWAFSTIGNLEGLSSIKTGKLVQYSEQQLVDCDTVDEGCNGGLMENAFKYIKEAGGIELQKDYPYHGRRESCHFNDKKVALKVSGFVIKNDLDEKEMMAMLANTGPLAIAINADPLQFYDGGIVDVSDAECDPDGLNHGVTLVGYGEENDQEYWIVKNSWGKNWGEDGYFRIAKGKKTCGVNKYISTATLE
jgi:cathepsin F